MKTKEGFSVVILLLSLQIIFSNIALASNKVAVSQVIHDFARAGDNQDGNMVVNILHKDARQYYLADGKITSLDTSTYKSLLNKSIIGGEQREVSIDDINISHDMAVVSASFSSKTANYINRFLLLRQEGHWKITSLIVSIIQK